MSKLTALINELNPVMLENKTSSDRIESIVTQHAIGAAATGLAAGIIPGLSGILGILTSTGIIWSMYYRISQELGIPFTKNVLKTLGSAFLSNIFCNLSSLLLAELVCSFIPGIAIVATGAICYAIAYLAGYLFIKLLVNVFKAGKTPEAMTAEELTAMGKAAGAEVNCAQIFKEAQADAKERIRKGEITKADAI